ncbi:MAG: cysteine hydrolase family protein [Bacteroidales bacterium]
MKSALLLIDLQNDYFQGYSFPLWNTEVVLERTLKLIERAKEADVEIIHIQHIADPELGLAPFFNRGTEGVNIRKEIMDAAPNGHVVVKTFADSFIKTDLEALLSKLGVQRLFVCGMMTQNCVTHTAISKHAEKYSVEIVQDCCTTVSEMLHLIALAAVSTRADLVNSDDIVF